MYIAMWYPGIMSRFLKSTACEEKQYYSLVPTTHASTFQNIACPVWVINGMGKKKECRCSHRRCHAILLSWLNFAFWLSCLLVDPAKRYLEILQSCMYVFTSKAVELLSTLLAGRADYAESILCLL